MEVTISPFQYQTNKEVIINYLVLQYGKKIDSVKTLYVLEEIELSIFLTTTSGHGFNNDINIMLIFKNILAMDMVKLHITCHNFKQ